MPIREFGLGPQEVRLLFTLEEEDQRVFEFSDARRILGSSDDAVKGVLHRLKRKHRIEQIEKGTYLLVPARAGTEGSWSETPYLIVPHLVDPYYVGFWTALNHWNLTEQVPHTVFVATTKRKRDLDYAGTTFQFVTLPGQKFFGSTEEETAGGRFRISDPEKTVIDSLYLPQYAGGLEEITKALWRGRDSLDFDQLVDYANRYGVDVLRRRLAYLLDVLDIGDHEQRELLPEAPTGYMLLDPQGPDDVLDYAQSYGLKVNRTTDDLLRWRGT